MTDARSHLQRALDDIRACANVARDRRYTMRQLLDLAGKLIDAAAALSGNAQIESCNPLQPTTPPLFSTLHVEPLVSENLAGAIYRERRMRDSIFREPDLFGEPAWDILLDLMDAENRRLRISITSACIASGVPPTTALRWIAALEDRGLVVRQQDETDRRRVFLALSDKGRTLMEAFFEARAKAHVRWADRRV
jgi:DNA-binding MarR family transcriptional regulator